MLTQSATFAYNNNVNITNKRGREAIGCQPVFH